MWSRPMSFPAVTAACAVALAACSSPDSPTAPSSDRPDLVAAAAAGVRIVNSPADPGDGVCTARECTLREALADPASTSITFASGLAGPITLDRKSTRLNSSHANISYAVFCLKNKTQAQP